MPQFAVQHNFCFLLFGEPFWNGGGLRKTRSQFKTQLPAFVSCSQKTFWNGPKVPLEKRGEVAKKKAASLESDACGCSI